MDGLIVMFANSKVIIIQYPFSLLAYCFDIKHSKLPIKSKLRNH